MSNVTGENYGGKVGMHVLCCVTCPIGCGWPGILVTDFINVQKVMGLSQKMGEFDLCQQAWLCAPCAAARMVRYMKAHKAENPRSNGRMGM